MAENSLFEIKQRVAAAHQTRKITNAMELIASSRLHSGRLLLANYQDWAKYMRAAARCLPGAYFKSLTGSAAVSKKAYLIFGGSEGLSGAYSPNVLQFVAPMVKEHLVIAVGSATATFFTDAHSCFGDEIPSADGAAAIVQMLKDLYENRIVSEVYIVYIRGTKPICERLFPLIQLEEQSEMLIFEPSKKVLYPELYQEYIETIVYEAYLHAFISEQIARVSAMDSASQNADEIIEELQSTYNRIRQSSITQEIIMVSNATRGGES